VVATTTWKRVVAGEPARRLWPSKEVTSRSEELGEEERIFTSSFRTSSCVVSVMRSYRCIRDRRRGGGPTTESAAAQVVTPVSCALSGAHASTSTARSSRFMGSFVVRWTVIRTRDGARWRENHGLQQEAPIK